MTLPSAHISPAKAVAVDVPTVSVVIVNFNGMALVRACLDSLQAAFSKYSSEIIVVDNASTDGSLEYLRNRRDIRLIECGLNLGFAGGNNVGVKAARGKLLLLLNNDTVCLSCLDPVVAEMEDERVGVAGCALFYADGRVQPSIGYEHTPFRVVLSWLGQKFPWSRAKVFSRVELDPDFYRSEHRLVDWVSGACMLTRTALWQAMDGMDEDFFMYCEDVDYCRRVRERGYQVIYTPVTKIRHYEAGGRQWVGQVALQRTAYSYLRFTRKHYGIVSQLFVAVSLGLVFLLRSVIYRVVTAAGTKRAMNSEKRHAYREVGIYLMTHGLGNPTLGTRV